MKSNSYKQVTDYNLQVVDKKEGKLFICATPLGNLKDISFRLLETLKNVDLILAEDTRVTQKILNKYQIQKKIITYNEHNKNKLNPQIINWLQDRKNIALISDAGMPGIADAGRELINLCREEKIKIEIIPGASAFLLALIYSGFSLDKFTFYSFAPKKEKEKKIFLEEIANKDKTIVFYETPHRLLSTLKVAGEILSERKICVAKELTKIFEEIFIDTAKNIYKQFLNKKIKGEYVIVISNKEAKKSAINNKLTKEEKNFIIQNLLMLIKMGYTKKDAVNFLKEKTKYSRNLIYQIANSQEIGGNLNAYL